MTVIEVVPLSGYKFNTDDIVIQNEMMRRFEIEENKLVTYWDEVCLRIIVIL